MKQEQIHPTHDAFRARERVLEDKFFADRDRKLIEQMREADRRAACRTAIRGKIGIEDPEVLEHLAALRLGAPGVRALALVPLALVAWADGTLAPAEAAAVREAAREAGLQGEPQAEALVESWLAEPPSEAMVEAWRLATRAVAARLPPEQRAALSRHTLDQAHHVAEAAGGFMHLAFRVSRAEQRALDRLLHALED